MDTEKGVVDTDSAAVIVKLYGPAPENITGTEGSNTLIDNVTVTNADSGTAQVAGQGTVALGAPLKTTSTAPLLPDTRKKMKL